MEIIADVIARDGPISFVWGSKHVESEVGDWAFWMEVGFADERN